MCASFVRIHCVGEQIRPDFFQALRIRYVIWNMSVHWDLKTNHNEEKQTDATNIINRSSAKITSPNLSQLSASRDLDDQNHVGIT
jgi:hypothetical protein